MSYRKDQYHYSPSLVESLLSEALYGSQKVYVRSSTPEADKVTGGKSGRPRDSHLDHWVELADVQQAYKWAKNRDGELLTNMCAYLNGDVKKRSGAQRHHDHVVRERRYTELRQKLVDSGSLIAD